MARLALPLALTTALVASTACGPVAPEIWPWSAVGRVLTDGQGPCSGVLVAPTLALTAGHCVADRAAWRAIAPGRLAFAVGRRSYAVAAVRLAAESPFDAAGAIRDLRHDWALLVLDHPADVAPVPYGGPAAARLAFVLDEPLVKVGWAGGRGLAAQRRDDQCVVRYLDPEATLLVYRCPDGHGGGRSGSALLMRSGDGWVILGVQSSVGDPGGVPLAVAVTPAVGLREEPPN